MSKKDGVLERNVKKIRILVKDEDSKFRYRINHDFEGSKGGYATDPSNLVSYIACIMNSPFSLGDEEYQYEAWFGPHTNEIGENNKTSIKAILRLRNYATSNR